MKARKHLDIRLPHLRIPLWWPDLPGDWRAWLPNRGNVLFTLLVVAGLLWATSVGALPLRAPAASTSTGTIAYQGRLADADGNPLTGTYNMIFRLYDVASGGTPLWTEQWTGSNGVRVSDGLFNVMLGSLTPIPQSVITGHDSLFLGITVGTDDEMTPRVQLGSVPFAVQALTVPDGSVTTDKLADGAVTPAKLNLIDGSVGIGTTEPTSSRLHVVGSGSGWAAMFNNTNGADVRLAFKDGHGIFVSSDAPGNPYLLQLNSGSSQVMRVDKDGSVDIHGPLDMHGNPIINQGAMVEAGLQTPAELAAERIGRFQQGDVLCWAGKRLEKCDQANDRRVVAVADENGKPIVIGAERIKVLGPVKAGDLLVASHVPGYAMVNTQPAPGIAIAKALEAFDGGKGLVKAMIRTP